MSINRPAFEPGARLVVARPLVFNGTNYEIGEEISGDDQRRMRQLYDRRLVDMAPLAQEPKELPKPEPPKPAATNQKKKG